MEYTRMKGGRGGAEKIDPLFNLFDSQLLIKERNGG